MASIVEELIHNLTDEGGAPSRVGETPLERRRIAARQLAEQGLPAVRPLLNCLAHPDREVRTLAGLALEQIGDPGVPFLLRLLQGEKTVLPEDDAAREDTFPRPLTELRRGAARILARLPDPRALEPLIDALADPESNLRAEAARALGYQADERAVVPLLGALGDESSGVRSRAAEALDRLALEEVAFQLMPEEEANLVQVLSGVLRRGPEELVRCWAAWGLGRLESPSALPALRSLVRFWKVTESPAVRGAVWEAIARIETAHQNTSGRELMTAPPSSTVSPEPTRRELSPVPPPATPPPDTGRELSNVSTPRSDNPPPTAEHPLPNGPSR